VTSIGVRGARRYTASTDSVVVAPVFRITLTQKFPFAGELTLGVALALTLRLSLLIVAPSQLLSLYFLGSFKIARHLLAVCNGALLFHTLKCFGIALPLLFPRGCQSFIALALRFEFCLLDIGRCLFGLKS